MRDIGVTTAMYGSTLFIALTLLASLATAVVYGLGGVLVIDNIFKIGTLVALAALISRLYGPITSLSNVQVDVMTALVSFDRVFEVLDLKPLITDAAGRERAARRRTRLRRSTSIRSGSGTRPPREISLASLESIALPVPEHTDANADVLRDVSLPRAGRASSPRWSGRPAPGKTTITQLVARLYDPDAGDGHDRRHRHHGP